jgi:hypothetical protein
VRRQIGEVGLDLRAKGSIFIRDKLRTGYGGQNADYRNNDK